eukprot:c8319_g1_i1.p2 GENE.c8319_g1_i1~~c8319_g1_i1.p2  ORF type:complete len:261 (-),score=59.40 c8319_g1_i1:67-849(-)
MSQDLISSATLNTNTFWEAFSTPVQKWIQLTDQNKPRGDVLLQLQMSLATATPRSVAQAFQLQNYFGVPIDVILHDPIRCRNGLPRFVAEAIDTIRRNGISEEGIFRLSGNRGAIYRLRTYLNLNWEISLDEEDVHTVTGALKLFFREMPDPLITASLYPTVLQIIGDNIRDENQQVALLKQLIFENSPPSHWTLMTALFGLLVEISSQSGVNKMGPKNLAVVFGPNILRPANDTQSILDMNHVQAATELFITRYTDFFG